METLIGNTMKNIHGLEIGDIGLRRDTNDRWKKFTVNSTYLPLIAEFPEDYKPLGQ